MTFVSVPHNVRVSRGDHTFWQGPCLFMVIRLICPNEYAKYLLMMKMLHLAPRIHQTAGLCCICLRSVDLAKGEAEKKAWGKNPCVGKKTNCRQGSSRLCSDAALSVGPLVEHRQKVGLLTLVSGRHRRADVERGGSKCSHFLSL